MDSIITTRSLFLLLSGLTLVLGGGSDSIVLAQDPAPQPGNSGDFHRAGNSQCVSRWAQQSRERAQVGYYVGGGRAIGGAGRSVTEGTWGNDYRPLLTRVNLHWTQGRRYGDGGGQYEPDRRNQPLRWKAPK